MIKIPNKVAPSIPPTTVVPRVFRETPPEPDANQSGKHPKTNANEVMRIGRKRIRAPVNAASMSDVPRSYSVLANSTMRIAFLAARPMSITNPIWACTLFSKLRPNSARNAPNTAVIGALLLVRLSWN